MDRVAPPPNRIVQGELQARPVDIHVDHVHPLAPVEPGGMGDEGFDDERAMVGEVASHVLEAPDRIPPGEDPEERGEHHRREPVDALHGDVGDVPPR